MSVEDPANQIFQKLLDSEQARDELLAAYEADLGATRLTLSMEGFSANTLMSTRALIEFADDLESQAKQEGWRDEADPVLAKLREVASEAATAEP